MTRLLTGSHSFIPATSFASICSSTNVMIRILASAFPAKLSSLLDNTYAGIICSRQHFSKRTNRTTEGNIHIHCRPIGLHFFTIQKKPST